MDKGRMLLGAMVLTLLGVAIGYVLAMSKRARKFSVLLYRPPEFAQVKPLI